tara:strand:+ start:193 stop:522 length:330 start_codon:yes stop_codon:yes gene_type:complete
MNHKEFFDVLVGKPPAEVELEIEIRKREVRDMPNAVVKEICLELIKENRLQDFLIMASIERISDINEKLIRYEISEHHRTKNLKTTKKKKFKTRKTLLDRFKTMLGVFR